MSGSNRDNKDNKSPKKTEEKGENPAKVNLPPLLRLPADILQHGIFSTVDLANQSRLARTGKPPKELLERQFDTNKVITCILKRKNNKAIAMLEKNPELLREIGQGEDLFHRTSDALTPFQSALKVGNFLIWRRMLKLFERLFPNDPEAKAKGYALALAQFEGLEAKACNYDLELMPIITPGTPIVANKLPGYGRVLLLQGDEKIIPTEIPQDAILIRKEGNTITTYKRIDNKIVKDNSFELAEEKEAEKNNIEEITETDREKIRMQKFAEHFPHFFPEVGAVPREITKDFFPALFEKTMSLCQYSLPELELPKKPMMIKQIDAQGDIKISVWGDVNGKWKITPLEEKDLSLFKELGFPQSDSKEPINTRGLNPSITDEMYEALKKYHTVSEYNNADYDNVMEIYENNVAVWAAATNYRQCEDYWCQEVGDRHTRLFALAMNYYCSSIPFEPTPKFKEEKLDRTFKLFNYLDETCINLSDKKDFFDEGLGENFAVTKREVAGRYGRYGCCVGLCEPDSAHSDRVAIATLCKVIDEKKRSSNSI